MGNLAPDRCDCWFSSVAFFKEGSRLVLNQVHHGETYNYNANSMRTRVDYQVAGQPNYHRLYNYDPVLRLTEQHKRWDLNNASAENRGQSSNFALN